MKNLLFSGLVLVFLTGCAGGLAQKDDFSTDHRGSLMHPPGYPAEEHVTDVARRGLW